MCSMFHGSVTGWFEAEVCSIYCRKGIRPGLNRSDKFLIMGRCRDSFCGKRLRAVSSQTTPVGQSWVHEPCVWCFCDNIFKEEQETLEQSVGSVEQKEGTPGLGKEEIHHGRADGGLLLERNHCSVLSMVVTPAPLRAGGWSEGVKFSPWKGRENFLVSCLSSCFPLPKSISICFNWQKIS